MIKDTKIKRVVYWDGEKMVRKPVDWSNGINFDELNHVKKKEIQCPECGAKFLEAR